jgi:hypothetical protein
MGEKTEDAMAGILNLCESDPDAALAFIEQIIINKPESESDPFGRFAKAMAYGSKGLFQLSRIKPQMDFTGFDENELRENLGITDMHLDYLDKGLHEIRQMEETSPGALGLFGTGEDRMGERKVDGMATVLDRCRPGRVQEILGKTKLVYFGPQRVGKHVDCQCSLQEWVRFRDVFFVPDRIAKSAFLALDGRDEAGRRYIVVVLKTSLDYRAEPTAEFPVAGFICLYSDGTYSRGSQPQSKTAASKRCAKCHSSVPLDALYCTQCGAKQ